MPGLHGGDRQVAKHRGDLGVHEAAGRTPDTEDADGVLRGEGGDGRGPEDAVGGERLQVGLDPGPPPESDPAMVSATGGPCDPPNAGSTRHIALAISAPYRRHYPDQVPRVVDRVADLSARFRRAPPRRPQSSIGPLIGPLWRGVVPTQSWPASAIDERRSATRSLVLRLRTPRTTSIGRGDAGRRRITSVHFRLSFPTLRRARRGVCSCSDERAIPGRFSRPEPALVVFAAETPGARA